MKGADKFRWFLDGIVEDADWEYGDGRPMTKDAKAFLKAHDALESTNRALLAALESLMPRQEYEYEAPAIMAARAAIAKAKGEG